VYRCANKPSDWLCCCCLLPLYLQAGRLPGFKKNDLLKCLQDIVFAYTYPRLDAEVTKKMNHLLKVGACRLSLCCWGDHASGGNTHIPSVAEDLCCMLGILGVLCSVCYSLLLLRRCRRRPSVCTPRQARCVCPSTQSRPGSLTQRLCPQCSSWCRSWVSSSRRQAALRHQPPRWVGGLVVGGGRAYVLASASYGYGCR
jgi:hypothetical protein